jgi:preprotein translocase subunit SecG
MTAVIPVLRVLHVFVTLAMIGVVLIQRSEGGGLGIGTSQGMGAFMSGRGTANLLTRTTSILAALFFGISLTLALLAHGTAAGQRDILAPTGNVVRVPARPAPPPPLGSPVGTPVPVRPVQPPGIAPEGPPSVPK